MLVTATCLIIGSAAGSLAQTSVAITPALPPKDVFEKLGDGPAMLMRQGSGIQLGAVAVVDLRRIILQRDNESNWTRTYITPLAEQLSSIGGVPYGAYLLAFCMPNFRRSEAAVYRRSIADVLARIDTSQIPAEDRPRQRQILEASDRMLARIETGEQVPRAELEAFALSLAPLIRANTDRVASDLKASLDAAMTEMRRILKAGEWEQLRIVIIDSQIPYAGLVQYAYFKQLLGTGAEGRLFFARGDNSVVGGLNAAFPSRLQSPASRAFFGDLGSSLRP